MSAWGNTTLCHGQHVDRELQVGRASVQYISYMISFTSSGGIISVTCVRRFQHFVCQNMRLMENLISIGACALKLLLCMKQLTSSRVEFLKNSSESRILGTWYDIR